MKIRSERYVNTVEQSCRVSSYPGPLTDIVRNLDIEDVFIDENKGGVCINDIEYNDRLKDEEDVVRCAPDFVIAGVRKCGTGALREFLGRHSQVKYIACCL